MAEERKGLRTDDSLAREMLDLAESTLLRHFIGKYGGILEPDDVRGNINLAIVNILNTPTSRSEYIEARSKKKFLAKVIDRPCVDDRRKLQRSKRNAEENLFPSVEDRWLVHEVATEQNVALPSDASLVGFPKRYGVLGVEDEVSKTGRLSSLAVDHIRNPIDGLIDELYTEDLIVRILRRLEGEVFEDKYLKILSVIIASPGLAQEEIAELAETTRASVRRAIDFFSETGEFLDCKDRSKKDRVEKLEIDGEKTFVLKTPFTPRKPSPEVTAAEWEAAKNQLSPF